jgi:hypothetical protein
VSLIALAAAIGRSIWKSEFAPHPAVTGIAVLPFENLSNDREDAFFADGVQDDILTKLAKIRDLKVISRTSVMQYRGKRNMREIATTLGDPGAAGQRSEKRKSASLERAINRYAHRRSCLGGTIRLRFKWPFCRAE